MKRKISIKGYQKKLEHMLRDKLIEERGRICELCRMERAEVADHCFSRKVRKLFFEPANLTILCHSCHFKKTNRMKSADLDIYTLVRLREGNEKFEEMYETARDHKPFPDFSKRWYLEEMELKIRGENL